jgi:polysaccharide pyruvyl transferase WcaK-like protein
MTPPRIAIIGSALSGNKGASAMLEAAIQTLGERLGEVDFTLFSMYPQEDAARNPYPNVEIVAADARQLGVSINTLALAYRMVPMLRRTLRRRSRAIAALVESTVLLDQGGITFTDRREKFLLYNIASILPALNVGTPVIKCAQAIGPFRHPVNRLASRIFLPKVRTIVTRGRVTHEYAVEFGLPNVVAGADFAFSLDLRGDEQEEVSHHVDLSFFDGDVVGVCPSVVMQKKIAARGGDYVDQIVRLIERLRAQGKPVLLIPHSVRTGTHRTHNNDMPLCQEIHSRLRLGDDLLFVDRELTSQQLRYLIGRCTLFVASRFHAMVSSLAMGVPTLVIGWSHKYREVLEMFELEQWALREDQLDSAELYLRFDQLDAQRADVKATLDKHLGRVRELSASQADLIAGVVVAG